MKELNGLDRVKKLRFTEPRPWLVFALIALTFGVQLKWWWSPTPDSANYLSMARHFSRGEIARLDSPHLRYAPGFPLVIAPTFWLADHPFLLISLIQFALVLAFAAGVYVWLRRYECRFAGLLTLLVMANVSLWRYYQVTLSEIAFMAELVWSGLLLDRLLQSDSTRQAVLRAAAVLPLLVLLCFTRQLGVFLVAAFGVLALLRGWKRALPWPAAIFRAALVGLPVLAAVLALLTWDHAIAARQPDGKSYHQYLDDQQQGAVQQVVEGVRLRVSEFGRLMVPGMFKSYGRPGDWLNPILPLYLLVTWLLALGWWRMARRRTDVLLLTLPLYTGFLVFWPFDQATRYMLPMLPVLVLALWGISHRWEPHRRAAVVGLLAAMHATAATVYWVRDLGDARLHAEWPAIEQLAETMGSRDAPVAALELDDARYWMLVFAADRMFPLGERADQLDPAARWVVAPADRADLPGFSQRQRAGSLRLFERDGIVGADERLASRRPRASPRPVTR